LELIVRVPPGAATGRYVSTVIVDVGPDGEHPVQITVPLELDIKAEG
jgi:hypothetical protein